MIKLGLNKLLFIEIHNLLTLLILEYVERYVGLDF